MRNFIATSFLFLFLLFSFSTFATTYYLSSSSGNDNNSGTDPSSAWQSLNRLNSFYNLRPGDNVLFKRGDTFYGSIRVNNSGNSGSSITYGAYGSGAKPIITGFTNITSWTNLGGSIWESTNAVSTLPYTNMVSVNGVNTAMGRYPNSTGPNTGYLTISSHVGSSSVTASGGLGSTNWTGAGIVVRKEPFCIERGTITSQSGNTLYYRDPNLFSAQDGYGFFVQNDPRALDVNGEWYYNPSTKKLRVYSTSTPNNVQIASIENLVSFDDRQGYITFDNIAFKGSNSDALYCMSYGPNLTVQNCDISFTGFSGIWCGMTNSILQSNNISYTNYLGIVSAQDNATIQYNNINNIDMLEGMDQNLFSGGAISSTGANTIIQYNDVETVGYSGIKFGGLNTKVQHNFVSGFCSIKEDGGGIDMSARDRARGSVIDANIVVNGTGSGNGTPIPTNLNFGGIFIDAYGTGITITNNTVANMPTSGIKSLGGNNLIIKNNTCYNNGGVSWCIGGLQLQSSSDFPVRNLTIQGNIFFAKTAQQPCMFAYSASSSSDVKNFGTFDNNYYAKPISQSNAISVNDSKYDVQGWKNFSGQDANSNGAPKSITDVNDLRFEYNATSSSKTISLDANYIDAKNNAYNGSVTLAPYTSVVLIRNGAKQITLLPAVNPSNTVNGLDYNYYEGSGFNVVPDFSKLDPVKSGTINNYDLSIANVAEGFAINFSGYIDVPTDGQYTFYTSSDDGSMLYIDNQMVVNNDGLHPSQEKSGIIGLKAGKHAISLGYTQQTGNSSLSVSYSGSGISKQVIPSTVLYRIADDLLPAVNPPNTVNGIDYQYYEASDFSTVPDFSKLNPVKTGTVSNYDLSSIANRAEEFAVNFSGFINVPTDGQYTFYTSSDDGSMLYIDNHLVVNNDGVHSLLEKSGTIGLQAGKHAISVGYAQQIGSASLSVSYSGPGISKQIIPSTVSYRYSGSDGLLPAVNPANTVNGIDYKYYEGSDFSTVPDFSKLTPIKTGTVANYDISIANRSEEFAVNFSGYINVPTDGQYTFYTSSDDGSMLYIDNQLIVNNDGQHSLQERSGTIGLKAGKHAISVGYTQEKMDASLSVSYSGPGISKQIIPSTVSYRVSDGLLPAVNPANTVNGIDYKYYERSDFSSVPDFTTLAPVKTGTVTNYDIYIAARAEEFAVNFSGYIYVPTDAQYTFYTSSDDGSMLYIDNQLIVNNDGTHSLQEKSGTVGLQAGKHAISVGYFQQKINASLTVSYSGPGIPKQPIPSTVSYRISTQNNQRRSTLSNGIDIDSASMKTAIVPKALESKELKVGVTAYPNPFVNSIIVSITGDAGPYNLTLIDALGRTLWVKKGTKSDGAYQQTINTSSIEKGIYFLRVVQNNKSSVIKLEK